jgi:HSP20 family protein
MNAQTTSNRPAPRAVLRPAVDIYESATAWKIVADLPQATQEDMSVTVQDRELLLDAVTADVAYRRTFRLPDEVDVERVAAHLEHGVLTLDLPKTAAALPRKVQIVAN